MICHSEMEYHFTIFGRLLGLNEYVAANRTKPHAGAKLKSDTEHFIAMFIRRYLHGVRIKRPVYMEYKWYEKNKRRDHDNVSSFGRKCIQDTLVQAHILTGDGWNEIVGFSDEFHVDRKNPRIEITIKEVAYRET